MPDKWAQYATQTGDKWSQYAVPSAPEGELSATDPDSESWLNDLMSDVRGGGGKTFVGRGLGFLQGRGDKGYTGLESGVSPAVADTMGSEILGPIKMAQGADEQLHGKGWRGLKDIVSGGLQTATLPSMFAGGPAMDTAMEAIPSRAHAGQVFRDIEQAATNAGIRVPTAQTVPALQDWRGVMQAGGKPAGQRGIQMLERENLGAVRNPNPNPGVSFPYPEARLRYSNITEQAREPILQKLMGRGMTPKVSRAAQGVRSAFNNDITQSLQPIGESDRYTDALREYARASKLRKGMIYAGLAAGEEAARRTGVLGRAARTLAGH